MCVGHSIGVCRVIAMGLHVGVDTAFRCLAKTANCVVAGGEYVGVFVGSTARCFQSLQASAGLGAP
jgi:hypothetical protein